MRGWTDHAPSRLSPAQTRIWERLYKESVYLYGQRWGAHVANKISGDSWTAGGKPRAAPRRSRLPDPGGMIWLGYTVSLQYYDPETRKPIAVKNFKQLPDCLWSPRLQAVMTYPQLKLPPATESEHSVPELMRLYRKWHNGKSAKHGVSRVQVPDPVPCSIFPGVVIVYRSDKFDADGDWVDYIHHLDPGSRGRPGPMVYKSSSAWMLRGGRLALTSGGLVH